MRPTGRWPLVYCARPGRKDPETRENHAGIHSLARMTTVLHKIGSFLPGGFLAHLSAIVGFLLALFLVARLMSERRAPANTFAWLLGNPRVSSVIAGATRPEQVAANTAAQFLAAAERHLASSGA